MTWNNEIVIVVLHLLFSTISSLSKNSYSNNYEYHTTSRIPIRSHYMAKSQQESSKLILTPLIMSGRVWEAKQAAKVKNPPFVEVLSYSGFITVNKTVNSNLFFWFFPAKNDSRNAPIMLWLEGGPGLSSLFSLFAEHGPLYIEPNGNLSQGQFSWTNSHSMLYVDNPVGTGFSFTDSKSGYATNQEDVSRDLFEFLQQFSMLFPGYGKNEWYIGGNSYAGKFIPPLALKIHKENELSRTATSRTTTRKFLNLKGIALGAPFSDPMSVINGHAEYFYFMGMVDENEKKDLDQKIAHLKSLIQKRDFLQAFAVQDSIFRGELGPNPSLLTNYSGFEKFSNIFKPSKRPEPLYVKFLNQEKIQDAIHVGRAKYHRHSKIVPQFLIGDIFIPTKHAIEKILNLNYQVLITVGQFDLYIPHTTLYNQIKSMEWNGKKAFLDTINRKRVWKVDGEVAGYIKRSNNLAYVIIRNAGHNAPFDQPKWSLDLIRHFTHGFQV